ncbi:MAG: carbohydrate-binding protein [Micromonosporaceae bacterium]|nr:carbohydrate-binding protein [Micromonosporaceae bacterium]
MTDGPSIPPRRRRRRLLGWLAVPALILAVAIVAVNLIGDPPAPPRGDHSVSDPSPAIARPSGTAQPSPTGSAATSLPSATPSGTRSAPPSPRPPATSARSAVQRTIRYEAEQAILSGARVGTDSSGTGYASFSATGAFAQWALHQPAGGPVTLRLRYSNGDHRDRPMELSIDGADLVQLDLPATGGWSHWRIVSVALTLATGTGTIRVTTIGRHGGPNLDYLEIAPRS